MGTERSRVREGEGEGEREEGREGGRERGRKGESEGERGGERERGREMNNAVTKRIHTLENVLLSTSTVPERVCFGSMH